MNYKTSLRASSIILFTFLLSTQSFLLSQQTSTSQSTLRRVPDNDETIALLSPPWFEASDEQYARVQVAKGPGTLLLCTSKAPSAVLRSYPNMIISRFEMPDGEIVSIELERFNVFSENAQFVEMTASGPKYTPKPEVLLYRGIVMDHPHSFVFVAVEKNALSGTIRIGSEEYKAITLRTSETDEYLLIEKTTPSGDGTTCAVRDDESPLLPQSMFRNLVQEFTANKITMDTLLAKVAIDADYECSQHYGGVAQAQNYITARFGEVSAIYERDIAVKLELSFLRVWTDVNDPYTANDMGNALNQFSVYWKANMDTVDRALAVLASQRVLDGFDAGVSAGLASLDALCNKTRGYAFDRLSGNNNFISGNTGVMAHEIGHVFGSRHTHSCWWNPAIDSCAGPEDGTCFTGNKQINGEIMSYCGSKTNEFRPKVAAWIRQRSQAATCLTVTSQIRNITVTSPAGGESLCAGSSVDITWTSTGVGNVKIELSTDGGASYTSTLVTTIPAPTRIWTWDIPAQLPSGNRFRIKITDVQVGSPIGISDANFEIKPATQITQQPLPKTVCEGASVTLSVVATGFGTLTYQWRKNGANIPGKTDPTLQLNNVTKADSGLYVVVVTGGCGAVSSQLTDVIVKKGAQITMQPENTTGCVGKQARIFVETTGDNLTYKWYKDLQLLPNATGSSLNFSSIAQSDQGSYFCQVTSACGPVISNTAYLTVSPPAITLNAPIGGEKYSIGENVIIQWSSSCLNKVKIEYSTNGGQSWTSAANDVEAIFAQYIYKLPASPTTQARIKITDASNGSVVKESGNFTVSASPVINLSATSLDFGNVSVGSVGSKIISISNTGIGQLDVTKTEVIGSPMFTHSNNGAFSLAPNANRTITMEFRPTASGQQTASLRIDHNAPGSPSIVTLFGNGITTGVTDESMPENFFLTQNTPNPFSSFTIISVRAQSQDIERDIRAGIFSLRIYDVFGREVMDATNRFAGTNSVTIHKYELPGAGVYFYRFTNGANSEWKKMTVVK